MTTKKVSAPKRRKPHWSIVLERLYACADAQAWAKTQPSARAAWRNCKRGDWLLWIAGKTCGDDRRAVVLAACACARLALKHVPKGEKRPLEAIKTAEAWARGKPGVTLDDVRNAAYAAADAAYAADAYAADAAYAAVNAADAAYAGNAADAAYAGNAANAANAAANAANAAYAVYASAAREKTLAECADIVRKMIPQPKVPS